MSNKFQKGFIFRQENCVGCGGCSVACQIHNELPEDVRFRKVDLYEVRRRPRQRRLVLSRLHALLKPDLFGGLPGSSLYQASRRHRRFG